MKNSLRILSVCLFLIMLSVAINGCKKDNNNGAPAVDFYLDLTSVQYSALNIVGGGFVYVRRRNSGHFDIKRRR